jgi:hypothetical protein
VAGVARTQPRRKIARYGIVESVAGRRAGKAALATCSPDGLEINGKLSVAGSGPSWAHSVVVGGRLYLRYDSNLYCFDVRRG